MNAEMPDGQRYTVSVHEPQDAPGRLVFTFIPRGFQQAHGPGRKPQYIVTAQGEGEPVVLDWSETSDDPGAAREEIEQDIRNRLRLRAAWIGRVTDLVDQVEQWAQKLGWATRRIEKRLEDAFIGRHRVPGLLMQEGVSRILLEPIGRSAPGTEGIVDLYMLPAYDDVASLYYTAGRWNLHYLFDGTAPAASIRAAPARPLSEETLAEVLAEMKQHAA